MGLTDPKLPVDRRIDEPVLPVPAAQAPVEAKVSEESVQEGQNHCGYLT